jgi:hypothetical protein
MTATIALSNSYVERVVENNARVSELLATNWHLVDPDDEGVFSHFQVHYMRYLHEVKQARCSKILFPVVMNLGPIPFMASEMIERVRRTFERQQRRLRTLRGQREQSRRAEAESSWRGFAARNTGAI